MKYYFTFGADSGHAHCGGWVVIEAKDYDSAREEFDERYGLSSTGVSRFAFQYDEDSFKKTIMFKQNSNWGHGEWK